MIPLKKNDMISIIVPVYNMEKYLRKCVDSLVGQTYTNIEIVLVDDGSRDGSGMICDEYAEKDPRVVVVHQENEGLSGARKKGISICHGQYLMFVDSDDWVDSEMCMGLYCAMCETNAESAMCGYIREYPDRGIPKLQFENDQVIESNVIVRKLCGPIGEELRFPENMESFNTVWGKLYPTSVVRDIGMMDTKTIGPSEDLMYNLAVFMKIKNTAFVSRPFYHYRKMVFTAITMTYRENMSKQWGTLYKCIEAFIAENQLDNECNGALRNRIALNVLGLGFNCICDHSPIGIKMERVRCILQDGVRKDALRYLDTNRMPLHWKIFYTCARKGRPFLVLLMLEIINFLRGKR